MDSTPNFGCGLECGLHSKKTGVPKALVQGQISLNIVFSTRNLIGAVAEIARLISLRSAADYVSNADSHVFHFSQEYTVLEGRLTKRSRVIFTWSLRLINGIDQAP